MFPIYDDLNRTKLIADKSKRGTANLFGIIAYTDANPNIKKVLRDSDYWDSFNHLSNGWIIYAIRPEYGQHVTYFTDENGYKKERCPFEFDYDFLQDFGISQDSSTHVLLLEVEKELSPVKAKASIHKASKAFKRFFHTVATAIPIASNS